ncbi:MAG: hypothetical protein AAF826_09770 [Pseudomonadota bacterium]
MKKSIWIAALLAATILSGCAAAIGVGGMIIADEILEEDNGGDGLF